MPWYGGNPVQAALAAKRRLRYPPDLLGNGPDRLLNVPVVATHADAIKAAWLPMVRNQAIPMVGERGYYEELPWDE